MLAEPVTGWETAFPAPVFLAHSHKNSASVEAMHEQCSQPLTVVLVLSCFLKLLDCLAPLLFCRSLFFPSQVRTLGGKRELATPCTPPPSWEYCVPKSSMKILSFQGF